MTRPLLACTALAVAALLTALPAHAQPKVASGEWEQTFTMSETDAPGHGGMKHTVRTCVTSEDVAIFTDHERWAAEVLKGADPQAKCTLRSSRQDGTAISAVLACAEDVVLTVRQDFQGKSGRIDAETRVGGVVQGSNRIESRWVSDTCTQETIERWKQQNPGRTFAP